MFNHHPCIYNRNYNRNISVYSMTQYSFIKRDHFTMTLSVSASGKYRKKCPVLFASLTTDELPVVCLLNETKEKNSTWEYQCWLRGKNVWEKVHVLFIHRFNHRSWFWCCYAALLPFRFTALYQFLFSFLRTQMFLGCTGSLSVLRDGVAVTWSCTQPQHMALFLFLALKSSFFFFLNFHFL